MHEAFTADTSADPETGHEIDGRALEHAGADASRNVIPAAEFQDDRVYARFSQQVREKHSCGTRTDDGHLSSQHFTFRAGIRSVIDRERNSVVKNSG
jgi:hypothetical protein